MVAFCPNPLEGAAGLTGASLRHQHVLKLYSSWIRSEWASRGSGTNPN